MIEGGQLVALARSDLALIAPNYEAMRSAIAICERVDEIADLADKSLALQAYYRQSQDVENEMQASRIRVRAERRLGEILHRMRETGERRGEHNENASRGATRLADLGIPRDRAARALTLAEVPEAEFEAALAEPRVAQPRRIVDEFKGRVPIQKTLNLWGRVRDLGSAIASGEVPPVSDWRENLQPFQLDELRKSIPIIVAYLSRIEKDLNHE